MTRRRVEAYYREEHAAGRAVLRTPEDVDALIDALLAGPATHNAAELHSLDRSLLPSGFPDHELLVGVDGTLRVGVLEFMDKRGNVVSIGESRERGEVAYCIAGNPVEFPDGSEIPIDLTRRAVKDFLASGGKRPECVEWRVPEFW